MLRLTRLGCGCLEHATGGGVTSVHNMVEESGQQGLGSKTLTGAKRLESLHHCREAANRLLTSPAVNDGGLTEDFE